MLRKILKQNGFTLIEVLLVMVLIGILIGIVLPRANRANHDAKYALVRQYGSEISGYLIQWAQEKITAQNESSSVTLRDFLMEKTDPTKVGFYSSPPVNHYTGNAAFDGVEALVSGYQKPTNPFNGTSYFAESNDDTVYVPSQKPGLLYLATALAPSTNRATRVFYFIFTGDNGQWYGGMNHLDEDAIRRGIFVANVPEAHYDPNAPVTQ